MATPSWLSDLPLDAGVDALAASLTNHEASARFHAGKASFELEGMRRLWEVLDRPLERRLVVHVAGSKGKGSVCLGLDALFGAFGVRRGLYVSPHVDRWGERVQLDGVGLDERRLGAAMAEVLVRAAERELERPTFFEVLTAAAFVELERHDPAVVVVETGLGGRLDATNVLPAPIAVLTSVELEHRAILGSTLSEIAREKCGIVKDHSRVVSGIQSTEAAAVVEEVCASRAATLWRVGRDVLLRPTGAGRRVELADGCELEIEGPAPRPYAAGNEALALAAWRLAAPRLELPWEEPRLRAGLAQIRAPARCERIGSHPVVYRDGAHTPDSLLETVRWVARRHPPKPPVLVLGMAADKRWQESLRRVQGEIGPLVATTVPGGRSAPPEELVGVARQLGLQAESVPRPRAALERARDQAGHDGSILVAGSFWLAGEFPAGDPPRGDPPCPPR